MIANRKIDQCLNRLTKWSEKPQWEDFLYQTYFLHLNSTLDEFDMLEDELVDLLSPEAVVSLNTAIFENFFTNFFGENGELNVINDYLKRRGSREPSVARQYLRELLDSSLSFYEVVELNPKERTVKVRDLLQEDTKLTIQMGSDIDDWAIWDCLGARVVSMSGKHYFTSGVLHLSRRLSKELVDSVETFAREVERRIIKQARKTYKNPAEIPSMPREVFRAAAPVAVLLIDAWLTEAVEIAEAPLPELYNTDNEKVILCEVRFPIRGDPTDVAALLDEVEEFVNLEEGNTWNWHELGSPSTRLAQHREELPESKKISKFDKGEIGSTALGFIRLRPKELVLSVNSAERADRGKMLLESCLGNLAGPSLTSYQDLNKAMDEELDSPNDFLPVMKEEILELQHAHVEDHYRRVLDEPVPMLRYKTPRKAALTKKGRSEVIEWLKALENYEYRNARRNGAEPYNMTWMWEELNVDK